MRHGLAAAVLLLTAGCSSGFSQADIDEAVAEALAEQATTTTVPTSDRVETAPQITAATPPSSTTTAVSSSTTTTEFVEPGIAVVGPHAFECGIALEGIYVQMLNIEANIENLLLPHLDEPDAIDDAVYILLQYQELVTSVAEGCTPWYEELSVAINGEGSETWSLLP
ncbi:hypothetical protein [Candidatus Poriferisodalis sp.]|uniref:hypothetical protein n=1 Tax=Candidatus Poriferisodalis sp. TaxID=3101277 RepID=UPI003B599410